MSTVATTYTTCRPSGLICGSLTRLKANRSSSVMGRAARAAVVINNRTPRDSGKGRRIDIDKTSRVRNSARPGDGVILADGLALASAAAVGTAAFNRRQPLAHGFAPPVVSRRSNDHIQASFFS